MKYIRTKDGRILEFDKMITPCIYKTKPNKKGVYEEIGNGWVYRLADTIEELCDCFVKIKRKKDYRDYILKFDFKDLPLLKEQRIKYPTSPVYGAIHVEDKGLIYVAKMNEKGELELL